jgi:hypothetical protein
MSEIRIRLEELDFQKLVRGEIIHTAVPGHGPLAICLADIGFDRMYKALDDAAGDIIETCSHGVNVEQEPCRECSERRNAEREAEINLAFYRSMPEP